MEPKSPSVKNSSETHERIRSEVPIRRIGVREFRTNFKALCDAEQPLIVCRGRRVVGVFLPCLLNWWEGENQRVKKWSSMPEALRRAMGTIDCLW